MSSIIQLLPDHVANQIAAGGCTKTFGCQRIT
jgi:DNA mismatch repair ATPase MutL